MSRSGMEFEGVVRPTRLGAGYLIFTFLIGFAALNTGNNSLYITLSVMLATLIVSGIASKSGLSALGAEVLELEEAWAGRPANIRVVIRNHSRLWAVRDLFLFAPWLERPVYLPLVPRKGTIAVEGSARFERRGRVSLSAVDLYTRFPFGLFTKKKRRSLTGEAVVFPRLLPESSIDERFVSIAGEQSPRAVAGHGMEIHGFRDYVRGDSLRQVHWKKSASVGRWIIKQTEQDGDRRITVAVDPLMDDPAQREVFEEMISAATTFIHAAFRRDLEVKLILRRGALIGGAPHQRRALFETLALMEPLPETAFPPVEQGVILFSLRSVSGKQVKSA